MIFRLFFAMLQFMSRLPVPGRWSQGLELNQYVRGIITFPFVGLLLGTLAGLVFIVLQPWCGLPLAALGYVLALIFVLVAKVLVVSELSLRGGNMLAVLAAASVAGRSASVLLMYRQKYARENGMGNLFIGKVSAKQAVLTLAGGAVLCVLLVPASGILAFAITLAAMLCFAWALGRTIGGHTGDTLGAAIELGEVIFLLALL